MSVSKLDQYVRHIRNRNKRDYAERFSIWVIKGERGREPGHGNLSAMGAQAVRMNVYQLLEKHGGVPSASADYGGKGADLMQRCVKAVKKSGIQVDPVKVCQVALRGK